MESRFKEILLEDMDNVFMNEEIHAIECMWNGLPLRIVENAGVELQEYETQGINKQLKKVHIAVADMEYKPATAEHVDINDEIWILHDVQEIEGEYIIVMERMG